MITWPMFFAVISAGLVGGFHCVGMCGGIAGLLGRIGWMNSSVVPSPVNPVATRTIPIHPVETPRSSANTKFLLYLHGGRISTYVLIGSIFGGVGAAAMSMMAWINVGPILYVLGNLFLLLLGLRLLGIVVPSLKVIQGPMARLTALLLPYLQRGARHPFMLGLAWGALPCGLTYVVMPFAILSGRAWSGAVLFLLFGLSALPHLLVTQIASQNLKSSVWMRLFRYVVASLLIILAITGLFFYDMQNMPTFLCVAPNRV